jgi:putative MATE family efflux protein
MTEGPVGRSLLMLTIPMLLGIYSFMLFNFVDTLYISRLGALELAAISFTFPVALVVGSLGQGIGVGASAIISRAIGEGDESNVRRITTDTLLLSLLGALAFTAIGITTIDPFFRLLGATPEVLPLIRQYMVLWYIGVPFVIIPLVGNNAIRATGDTRTPATIMILSAVSNAILDPFLIFGIWIFPEMGLTGAALASLLARAASLFAGLWVIGHRERLLTFVRPPLATVLDSWRQILFIGLPAAGTNVLTPVSFGIITAMVAVFGPEAVAALGAGIRITALVMGVFMATASVLTPFVGQNLGAGHPLRARAAVAQAQRFAIIWGAVLIVVLAVFGRQVALIFSDDPAVIEPLVRYLWIVPVGCGSFGVMMVSSAGLNAYRRPLQAAVLTAGRLFALQIPIAIAGSLWLGLDGIFAAVVIADVLACVASYIWLRRIMTRENSLDTA